MVSYLLDHLDLDDVWQLSLTCRRLRSLVTESHIAKRLLETKAPAATETKNALIVKNYAHELRRLLKRRQSISSVTPYLAAVVGFGEDWIYQNGVLCYIQQGQLRILDLHGSAAAEIVVNIRLFLDEAIPGSRNIRNYRFRPLNISNNIVSCLYYYKPRCTTGCDFGSVYAGSLVVFSAQTRKVLTTRRLENFDPNGLTVRNNDGFLFLIERSHYHEGRAALWNSYNFSANAWHDHTHLLHLDFHSSEIGITHCFEIFNGHVYFLSNYSELEEEEGDWVSPYHCLRFPFAFNAPEILGHGQLLRRTHLDGPMDHRWTFLKMFKDEATGKTKILESRKEWIKGSSSTTRTYYTTTIKWPDKKESHGVHDSLENGSYRSSTSGNDFGGNSTSPGYASNPGDEPQPEDGTSGPGESDSNHRRVNRAPRILPPRDSQDIHPGDDSSKGPIFPRSKCPILSYHPSCQTFLDLVDLSPSNSDKLQMRLRGGTRHRRRPEEIEERSRSTDDESSLSVAEKHFKKVYKMYKHEEPITWPPDQDPNSPNTALAQLYEILSPPKYAGEITGDWDERSFVYAAQATDGSKEKALVFISFDPSISLAGTLPYPGPMVLGRPQPTTDRNAPTTTDDRSAAPNSHDDEPRRGRQLERAGHTARERQAVRRRHVSTARNAPAEATQVRSTKTDAIWCTIEPAQYQTIKKGFHFCV
ncbi:hypothetical protein B0T09DRAFT_86759 [Sordaria sp. MPI-SDFR-AT-0083]|nr:hypothetical protein B0T09DRAFT_86759 [Sordaria sp. MPI-SDFR-AT-0083]